MSSVLATDHNNKFIDEENIDDNFFDVEQVTEIEDTRVLPDNLIKNPFFITPKETSSAKLSCDKLFKTFNKAICLCLKNNTNVSTSVLSTIYNYALQENEITNLTNYFTLKRISIKLLRNQFHKQTALFINQSVLNGFNSNAIKLEDVELLIPLVELRENIVDIYSAMYESEYTIGVMLKSCLLYQYFNCDAYKYIIIDRLSKILNDTSESNYWCNPYHCDINLTHAFKHRIFAYKEQPNENITLILPNKKNIINDEIQTMIDKLSEKNQIKILIMILKILNIIMIMLILQPLIKHISRNLIKLIQMD